MKARFFQSLMWGVIIAAAVTGYADKFRHAAIVASAAKSGGHQTVQSILADGFIGTTIGATLLLLVLSTLGAGRQRRRATASPAPAPRRARAGARR